MSFSKKDIQDAWNRATSVDGYDETRFRKDACGAWMIWDKYGDTDSFYGWVIDHVVPRSLLEEKGFSDGMIDNPLNLRALQHDNNRSKSDDYPSYTAVVTSKGAENIKEWTYLQVNEKKQKALNALYNL